MTGRSHHPVTVFATRVNNPDAVRGSLPCFARVDHIPDSEDSGDKSWARAAADSTGSWGRWMPRRGLKTEQSAAATRDMRLGRRFGLG